MHYTIGVDVGGTKILIGKVSTDASVWDEKRYDSHRGSQENATRAVLDAIHDYLKNIDGNPPEAIGIGLVGQVDYRQGTWVSSLATPITTPFPLCSILASEFPGLRFFADNDVHVATLAELNMGAGKRAKDFVYLNIGTGIAAGIVSNGRIVRGSHNLAGEIGHTSIDIYGPLCRCGRRGCIEPLVSGGGMIRVARERLKEYPDSSLAQADKDGRLFSTTIFQESEEGDPLAQEISRMVLDATVSMLQDLIYLTDPEEIIFGGGVFRGGWLESRAKAQIIRWLPDSYSDIRIAVSELDPQKVGLMGAAELARNCLRI